MIKRKKGSLTVEASVLIPIILFLLAAIIYLFFFLHDSVIMQSSGFRVAERSLWQQNGSSDRSGEEIVYDLPVLMMNIGEFSCKKKGIMTEFTDLAESRESVKVQVEGEMKIEIPGSTLFAGNTLKAGITGSAVRICYSEDRLRTIFLQKGKDVEE